MYSGAEFKKMLSWIKKYPGKLGVEIFVMFHEPEFETVLGECEEELKSTSVSFHEPYWDADHSYPMGTDEYVHTMEMICKTLPYMKTLNAEYMVFHHNNREVKKEERCAMIETARKNYYETRELCSKNGITLAVENAGVGANAIFNEKEFIEECEQLGCPVLIDIGHAFANGWNLENVVKRLQNQIISYHIHNNNGKDDCHWRIHNGKMNFDSFLKIHKKYTPNAHLVLEYCNEVSNDEAGIEEDINFLVNI